MSSCIGSGNIAQGYHIWTVHTNSSMARILQNGSYLELPMHLGQLMWWDANVGSHVPTVKQLIAAVIATRG